MLKALIIGGGYSGLAAAHKLGQHGIESTIIEANSCIGGLARCQMLDNIKIEKTYHHIKPEDTVILHLIDRLGLREALSWTDTRMGFYLGGETYKLSTGFDLLRFKPFSMIDKFRFAMGVLKSRRVDGRTLDGLSAKDWVVRDWSHNIYHKMMAPMLLNKFGISPSEISAGFLHGRIKGLSSAKSSINRGEQLGYLRGSLQRLTDRFETEVKQHAEILTNTVVERIEKIAEGFSVSGDGFEIKAQFLVNTLPAKEFEKIVNNFEFTNPDIRYQGAICSLFSIKEELTPIYWTNIIDPDITFRVLVNQTVLDDYDKTIVYCANYVPVSHELYQQPDHEIIKRYQKSLEKMYGRVTIIDHSVFRTPYATPIFDKNFQRKISYLDKVAANMLFAGAVKIYPGSRTLSTIIRTGYSAADQIIDRL